MSVSPSPLALFSASGITKRYGTRLVLDSVDLALFPHELVTLVGPNGAGKSTLIKIIVGHAAPDTGTVSIGELSAHRIGYAPEVSMIYPLLTVTEHLRFVELSRDLPHLSRGEEARFLERFGLLDHRDHLANNLSKGMKRRLMLACAVRAHARLLVLDEPFDGLDPDGQDFLSALLSELAEQGAGVLVSTHRLDIAERIGTRIVILDHGHIKGDGTLSELRLQAGMPDSSLWNIFMSLTHFPRNEYRDVR